MQCVIVRMVILLAFQIPSLYMIENYDFEESIEFPRRDDILRRHSRQHLRQKRWLQEITKYEELGSRELANKNELPDIKGPITPIMNYHKRRQFGKFTTSTDSSKAKGTEDKNFQIQPFLTPNKEVSSSSRSDFAFRRGLDPNFNAPVQGVHCMELISPHFLGETNLGMFKIVRSQDHVVYSLIDLLAEHTDSKSEIYSILYQISTMKIRLYQWDDKALRLLVNQITKDRLQSFRTLKAGVKQLFANWHLDITNITNLLLQSKIFRPPCVQTSEFSGSTKGTSPNEFRKPPTTKKVCPSNEDEDGDC